MIHTVVLQFTNLFFSMIFGKDDIFIFKFGRWPGCVSLNAEFRNGSTILWSTFLFPKMNWSETEAFINWDIVEFQNNWRNIQEQNFTIQWNYSLVCKKCPECGFHFYWAAFNNVLFTCSLWSWLDSRDVPQSSVLFSCTTSFFINTLSCSLPCSSCWYHCETSSPPIVKALTQFHFFCCAHCWLG